MNTVISLCKNNPSYWEINGKPTMLIGGSVEDNLFQIADLEKHLELLKAVGGNYVRCTMSSRDPGNVWPYEVGENILYDLNKSSDAYWKKVDEILEITDRLGIIAQIELWDRFDFAREPWQRNPFNPKNNINYSFEESLLAEEIDRHPCFNDNRFFFTVPEYDDNKILMDYQLKYIDELLKRTLEYKNIIYCMDNETGAVEEWGKFWSLYILEKAKKRKLTVYTTEMWENWDLSAQEHKRTFDHPEYYAFCDISQNNHQKGDKHWAGIEKAKKKVQENLLPLNNVKVYGSDVDSHGNKQHALECFWRNMLGGAAAVRFHRPPAGIGLSELSQSNIKSARMLIDKLDIYSCATDKDVLLERRENNAYCTVNQNQIAIYFTGWGSVTVDTSQLPEKIKIEWLDILKSKWMDEYVCDNLKTLNISTLGKDMYVLIISGAV